MSLWIRQKKKIFNLPASESFPMTHNWKYIYFNQYKIADKKEGFVQE